MLASITLALLLAVAPGTTASEAGTLALRVTDGDAILLEELPKALNSSDALTRAAAARVALVRDFSALVPALRDALQKEQDAVAAREEARALLLLGGVGELDRAVAASARFEHRLDGSIAVAVGRLGPKVSMETYFTRLHDFAALSDGENFFRVALWGAGQYVTPIASKLLAAQDARGFEHLIDAVDAPSAVEPGILAAAINDTNPRLRYVAAKVVLQTLSDKNARPIDQRLLDAIGAAPDLAPQAQPDERIAAELLRRVALMKAQSLAEPLQGNSEERISSRFGTRGLELLTADERRLLKRTSMPVPLVQVHSFASDAITPPPYTLPARLPDGLARAVVEASGCKGGWVGVGSSTVDEIGRVRSIDVSKVEASIPCKRALDTLLRLSIVSNRTLTSAPTNPSVLLVKSDRRDPCLDEGAPRILRGGIDSTQRVGGEVKAPVVKSRVDPLFPASARQAMRGGANSVVIVESRITRAGCVADLQLLKQTQFAELNTSALLAVDQWLFEPGTSNGEPIDVLFNLTISFKMNQ